jgi:hypothetical protein
MGSTELREQAESLDRFMRIGFSCVKRLTFDAGWG